MTELAILAVAGFGTWGIRASFIAGFGVRRLPDFATQSFVHARLAVLGALVATAVAGDAGLRAYAGPSPEILAAAAASWVAWCTGGMLRTLGVGMLALAAAAAVWP